MKYALFCPRQFGLGVHANQLQTPVAKRPATVQTALALAVALTVPISVSAQLPSENIPSESGDAVTTLATVHIEDRPDNVSRDVNSFGFGSQPNERTPIAMDALDRADLDQRGVHSLSDAIRLTAGVSDDYNTFGYIEGLQVRGFALNELFNYQRDGLTVSNHVPLALEDKERIEILKGTSAMEAGVSAPGGLVNYVLKQPTEQTLNQVDVSLSERGSAALHADFGGRVGASQQFGYRVNLAGEDRHPQIDQAWSHRGLLSGFFDWRVRDGTLVQLEFEHQYVAQISVPGYGLTDTSGSGIATTLPAVISPSLNLNDQPWTQPFQSVANTGSVRFSQDLSPDWNLRLRMGTQRSTTNDRIAFADGCSSGSNYVYNGMCGNGDIDIYQYVSDGERRVSNDADLRLQGRLQTLSATHEVSLGLTSTRYTERYPLLQTYNYVGTVNVYDPIVLPANPTPGNPNAPLDIDTQQVYAFDSAHYAHGLSSWIGGRMVRMVQDSQLTDGTNRTHLDQHQSSPWLGLGYQATPRVFTYLSYGQGLELATAPNHVTQRTTGATLTIDNPGQALPAQRSRQTELGLKWHPGANWALDAALYRITKPFVDNVPVNAGADYVQVTGAREERHQGLDVNALFKTSSQLDWRASLAWIDARTTSAADPTWVGKPAQNVAPLSVAIQENWRRQGLLWSNLIHFTTHTAALPDGSVSLPNYWQWDTSAQYTWQHGTMRYTLRGGIDNVTQQVYWREAPMASWGSVYLFPGPARTARLGLQVQW